MLEDQTKSCLPCGLHEPQRNNYFDGKLLVSKDFTDEQDYGRGHRRLHNALLHGTGTVCGLKLVQHPADGCRNDFVVVQPGMALDCCGNEIIVPVQTGLNIAKMLTEDPDLAKALDGTKHLFIGIERCDVGTMLVPVLLPGCSAFNDGNYGRIAERFKFVLSAKDPKKVTPVEVPVTAKLEWVHTITLGAQKPRALHINDGEKWLQIAADSTSKGAHLYLHDSDTQDLVSLLEMKGASTDTASSREDQLVFAAGSFLVGGAEVSGIGVWRAAKARTEAAPEAVIHCELASSRIAVSPTSGALLVLNFDKENAVLVSFSAENLLQWLNNPARGKRPDETASLKFEHGFGTETDAPLRGAAMMQFSHDGRFIALAAPGGKAAEMLYLINVSKLNAGGMKPKDALVKDLKLAETDTLCSVAWSLDDEFFYLLTNSTEAAAQTTLLRFRLAGENELKPQGRGITLAASGLDLAIAPTETRAYILVNDGEDTRLTTIDMELVKAEGSAPQATELSTETITIDGAGLSMALAPNGARAYVAAADANAESMPDRGLVAVIDISENDCGIHFDKIIEGCSHCDDTEDHAVILGHLPLYNAAGKPFIVNPGTAGDNIVIIDNKTYRPIVPSAHTLHEVIECILAQGVAEGPPGPRGDPGVQGADGPVGPNGKSITGVTVAAGAVGSNPSATTTEQPGGLIVNLTIPAPAPGANGIGIDKATVVYDAAITTPQVSITGNSPNRTLAIKLPAPVTAPAEDLNTIVAMSWKHAAEFGTASEFRDALVGKGIAVGFAKPVFWPPFTGSNKGGPTMLAELQRKVITGANTSVWAAFDLIEAHPIRNLKFDPADKTLLTAWDEPGSAEESDGFMLRASDNFEFGVPDREPVRLVFYADFVTDKEGKLILDGSHIGGQLPTGRGGPGDTFLSWFTVTEG